MKQTMCTPQEALFFAGKSAEMSLYSLLIERMKSDLPPFELRVQKTQITFVNPKVFACVSLKWKGSITITFGLPDCVGSPRIHQTVQIRHHRWTHHVKVSHPDEIDAELMRWLDGAYAYAAR